MIIEVHRRESLNAPLEYNIKKLDQCHAEVIASKWIPKDASGEEIYTCLQANALNTRVKKPFFHLSINPDCADWEKGLTVEQLAEMSKEAVDKLFPGVPYLIFVHKDISRWHAHAVGPCITREGKLIPDRFEWNRAMRVSRELEIKYNLERALEHTEEHRVTRAEPIRYEDGDLSRKIGDVLALAKTYRFTRLGELNAFLNLYNCGFDQVDNDKKRGLSYYVLKDGKRVGRAIIATKIHGGALSSVEKQIKNRDALALEYASVRIKINACRTKSRDFEQFKEHLEQMQVRTTERIDPDGKILGVTFVDDENKVIVNGSCLGREYSYLNILKSFEVYSDISGGTFIHGEDIVEEEEEVPEEAPKRGFFAALGNLLSIGASGASGYRKKKKRGR